MPKWDFTKVKDKDQQEQLWIDEAAPVSVQKTQKGPKWDFTKVPGTDQVVPRKPDQVPETKSLPEIKPPASIAEQPH